MQHHLDIAGIILSHGLLLNIADGGVENEGARDHRHAEQVEIRRCGRVDQRECGEADAHGNGGQKVQWAVFLLLDQNASDQHRHQFAALEDD